MKLDSIDYLLYKYPNNPITKLIIWLVFLGYGNYLPWDRDNLRVEWSADFGTWYITLVLDGYDDELAASMIYISGYTEDELQFMITAEREHHQTKTVNVPLSFIKVTEVTI